MEINRNRFRSSPGAIAGTVVGSVAFVIIIVIFMLWRRKVQLAKEQEAEMVATTEGASDTMPYAQRAAMEDALALSNPPIVKKTRWFQLL